MSRAGAAASTTAGGPGGQRPPADCSPFARGICTSHSHGRRRRDAGSIRCACVWPRCAGGRTCPSRCNAQGIYTYARTCATNTRAVDVGSAACAPGCLQLDGVHGHHHRRPESNPAAGGQGNYWRAVTAGCVQISAAASACCSRVRRVNGWPASWAAPDHLDGAGAALKDEPASNGAGEVGAANLDDLAILTLI